MDHIFILNSILFGVGLAMDAFSVSIANGLIEPDMSKKRAACIAGVYGAFQFAMPMAGWICVHTITRIFTAFEAAIPWIALILLGFLGIKMLVEGFGDEEEQHTKKLTVKVLLLQGIATAIDALSVGFTIANYPWNMAIIESLIIAAVTFFICLIALKIGRVIGTRWSSGAVILGGFILIGIGVEIFITGVLF